MGLMMSVRLYVCALQTGNVQESHAVAKTTARCAQCMGDQKKCRIPWLRIWLLFL